MNSKTVGVLIDWLDGAYQSQLMKGFAAGAHELGLHVLCFPGDHLGSSNGFAREFNILFHLATLYKMQGVVSISGSLTADMQSGMLADFFSRLGDTPIVSIGKGGEGIPVIRPDNRRGMVELVDHFIHHHGFRRIAFITGPEHHADAQERLEVFRERHAKAGLVIDEKLILTGYFDRESGRRAAAKIVSEGLNPDAIISANDEMAVTAIASLLERGLRIPDDIAVGGFDDLSSILRHGPPLTSVRQATAYHSQLALRTLVECWNGTPPPADTRVATRAIVRYSCGCSGLTCSPTTTALWDVPETAAVELESLRIAFLADLSGEHGRFHREIADCVRKAAVANRPFSDLRNILLVLHGELAHSRSVPAASAGQAAALIFAEQVWLTEQERMYVADKVLEAAFPAWVPSNLLLTGMSSSNMTLGRMLQFLRDTLISVGARNAYIVLFPQIGHMRQWYDCEVPEEAQLVLAIRDGVALPTADFERFPVRNLLPFPVFPNEKGALYTMMPLFQQQEHYGYMILDMECAYGVRLEQLREVISNLVVSTIVVGELDRARQLLKQDLDRVEESNQELAVLSERDELTGLLNRRGFFAQAAPLRLESEESLLLISADMDGLKKINDTWGHAAGDRAIAALATVLKAAFRSGDLIARLGGDEFVILSRSFSPDAETRIRSRLAERIAHFNATQNLEWTLAVSMGFMTIPTSDEVSFEERLDMADRLLYEEKRRRKMMAQAAA